jgi:hypothetical protein
VLTPNGTGLKATDFNASRSLAMSRELNQYRILHVATHGLLKSERPELSWLVFPLIDLEGKSQDGFLLLFAKLTVVALLHFGLDHTVIARGFILYVFQQGADPLLEVRLVLAW